MSVHILTREQWQALMSEFVGVEDTNSDATVRTTAHGVYVERFDGVSSVDILGSRAGTDIRIGCMQVLVSRDRVVVLSHPGRYPVSEWSMLLDAKLR